MPTLIVENVPADIYERLQKRAAAEHSSLAEAILQVLKQMDRDALPPRLPDLIFDEAIPAPFDLPRSSEPEQLQSVVDATEPRLPDPITDDDAE